MWISILLYQLRIVMNKKQNIENIRMLLLLVSSTVLTVPVKCMSAKCPTRLRYHDTIFFTTFSFSSEIVAGLLTISFSSPIENSNGVRPKDLGGQSITPL